ncbi:MAG: hypothetical protein QM796_14560 [Chthoniobacteraceae bacterium]
MKIKTHNKPRLRHARWYITIATALGLSPWACGQAFYEQRFNDPGQVEFKDGAGQGPDGSGVSGKPEDKAYSVDTSSSPKALAVIPPLQAPKGGDELTVTAWYKPRGDVSTLYSAYGSVLIWDQSKSQWIWRVEAKLSDPQSKMYWFYSGKPPLSNWVPSGQWTFVALVWDRAAGKATFYQGNKTSEVVLAREMTRNEKVEPLDFSRYPRNVIGNDRTSTDRAFDGEIDNVRFFSGALHLEAIEKIRKADVNNEPVNLPAI